MSCSPFNQGRRRYGHKAKARRRRERSGMNKTQYEEQHGKQRILLGSIEKLTEDSKMLKRIRERVQNRFGSLRSGSRHRVASCTFCDVTGWVAVYERETRKRKITGNSRAFGRASFIEIWMYSTVRNVAAARGSRFLSCGP